MPTLLEQIPDAGSVTALIDRAGTKFTAATSPLSSMPIAGIGQLSVKLDINPPDLSGEIGATASAFTNALGEVPDPSKFIEPLTAVLESIKAIAEFQIGYEIRAVSEKLTGTLKTPPADLQGLVSALTGPFAEIQKLIELPQIETLLSGMVRISGGNDVRAEIASVIKTMGQMSDKILQGGIGNTLSSLLPLLSFESFTLRLEKWAAAIGSSISANSVNGAFARFMAKCTGEGMAERIKNADLSDPAQVRALVRELNQVHGMFTSFAQSFSRDLSSLGRCAASFDKDLFKKKVGKITAPLDHADLPALQVVSNQVKGLLFKLTNALGEIDPTIDLAMIKSSLSTGMRDFTGKLEAFDLGGLEKAIRAPLDEILGLFDGIQDRQTGIALEVGGFYQSVREKITAINLEVVTQPVVSCLDQIDGILVELSRLAASIRSEIEGVVTSINGALQDINDFINNGSTGLKVQLEGALTPVRDTLRGLDIQGMLKESGDKIGEIIDKLKEVSFDEVIDPVVKELEDLGIVLKGIDLSNMPDMVKVGLAVALQAIKGFNFDVEITGKLSGQVDEITDSVKKKTLAPLRRAVQEVQDKIAAFDPARIIAGELREKSYVPALAELRKVNPSELFKEAEGKLSRVMSDLDHFKPGILLEPVQKAFEDMLAAFQKASPAALVDQLESLLTEAREKVTAALTIDAWTAKLRETIVPIETLLSRTDIPVLLDKAEAVFTQIRAPLDRLESSQLAEPVAAPLAAIVRRIGIPLSSPGVSELVRRLLAGENVNLADRLLTAIKSEIGKANAELKSIDLPGMTLQARKSYVDLRAALGTHDTAAAGYAEIHSLLKSFDCMAAFASISAGRDKAEKRLETTLGAVGEVLTSTGHSLDKIGEVHNAIQGALPGLGPLGEIFTTVAHALFPDLSPVTWTGFVKALVRELDPAPMRQDLQALLTALKSRAMLLTGDHGIVTSVESALNEVKAKFEILSVGFLRDALEGVFSEVEAKIKELEPRHLAEPLDAKYQKVIDALKDIGLDSMGKDLSTLYENEVLKVMADLDPAKTLQPPLEQIYSQIVETFGAIDIEAIFKPLVAELEEVSMSLKAGLEEAGEAFHIMLNAVPAGASVSVSGG